jgi:hypothetical protein
MSQDFMIYDVGMSAQPAEPKEDVELDLNAPAELRRLWNIRQKWICEKGQGMWDSIVEDLLGPDETIALSEEKKMRVKASLQMKVHRGVLRHGKWPECDVNMKPP